MQPPTTPGRQAWTPPGSSSPHAAITCARVVALPDGGRILAGGYSDGSLRLWDPDQRQPLGWIDTGHGTGIDCLATALTPDGVPIAVTGGGWGSTARAWDLAAQTPVDDLLADSSDWLVVLDAATLPDGTVAVLAHDRETALGVWDLAGRSLVVRLDTAMPSPPETAALLAPARGGLTIATGHDDERVRLWDVGTGERVGEYATAPGEEVYAVYAPGSDGHTVSAASRGGTVRTWDTRSRTTTDVSRVPGHLTVLAGDSRHLVCARAGDPVVLTRTEE
ncbi:WD40 repeat domain-containing protein [Nocardiopsis metallicus]|uniref:WD40 repeat protein n=1 Tax=Nocardiopsis metallicus TaxID=179819 RepID=A0A840W000_9ACTN|nr:WD40 repeat domain-containing protein [Nocardiopsis metallicus]MBB5490059.1 WD40 repeat protein [Nocardiopsis metallicus]